MRFLITLFLILAFTLSGPPAEAGIRKIALASICAGGLAIGGCAEPHDVKYERLRKEAVVSLKAKKDVAEKPHQSLMLSLRYFAFTSNLVFERVVTTQPVDQMESLPSDELFDGIAFEVDGKRVHLSAFIERLSWEEKVALELELDRLGEYFTERFSHYRPRRVGFNYTYQTSGSSYSAHYGRRPLTVIFSKGGKSKLEEVSKTAILKEIEYANYGRYIISDCHMPPSGFSNVTLDVSDLPTTGQKNESPRKPWRQWLSEAKYPGEF